MSVGQFSISIEILFLIKFILSCCRKHSEAKPFKSKDIDVAKLFSKHFKLAEHVEYLDKTKVSVAVAAPNRIGKLLSETSALPQLHE
jgi:hypothetical protein